MCTYMRSLDQNMLDDAVAAALMGKWVSVVWFNTADGV